MLVKHLVAIVVIAVSVVGIAAEETTPKPKKTVDQFCDQLRNRLDGVERQLATLRSTVKALPKQGEQALQKSLDQARSKVESQNRTLGQAQAKLKADAEQKVSETQGTINQWKAKREIKKLNAQADRAEKDAADAIDFAVAALDRSRNSDFQCRFSPNGRGCRTSAPGSSATLKWLLNRSIGIALATGVSDLPRLGRHETQSTADTLPTFDWRP